MTFASGLLYDFDSDVVKAGAPATTCAPWPRASRSIPSSDILILGHTDSVGTDAYNKTLSVRRADAAAEYLVAQGVARSRIGTGGLGEEEPVASNADEAGRQKNRRVEVAIYASKELQEEAQRSARAGETGNDDGHPKVAVAVHSGVWLPWRRSVLHEDQVLRRRPELLGLRDLDGAGDLAVLG